MSEFAPWLRSRLRLAAPTSVEVRRRDRVSFDGYDRELLEYCGDDGATISAFLFTPTKTRASGGVVAFHQHNSELHLGKSEVAGLAGSKLQAFGPALAERGGAVLAPDAITFEDRRTQVAGIEPHAGDWLQHYNAMAYRLVNGDLVMRKALDDAQRAVSVLLDEARVEPGRVGVSGHSYGGTTAMYLAAVDPRCRFACISGAVSSFAARQRNGTGISMFELVPGLARRTLPRGWRTRTGRSAVRRDRELARITRIWDRQSVVGILAKTSRCRVPDPEEADRQASGPIQVSR